MKRLRIIQLVIVLTSFMTFSSCDKDDPTSEIKDLSSYLQAYSWDMSVVSSNYVGVVTFDNKGVYTLTRDAGTPEIFSYVVDVAKSNVTVSNSTGTEEYHVTWDRNGTEMKWDGVTTNFMHLIYVAK